MSIRLKNEDEIFVITDGEGGCQVEGFSEEKAALEKVSEILQGQTLEEYTRGTGFSDPEELFIISGKIIKPVPKSEVTEYRFTNTNKS